MTFHTEIKIPIKITVNQAKMTFIICTQQSKQVYGFLEYCPNCQIKDKINRQYLIKNLYIWNVKRKCDFYSESLQEVISHIEKTTNFSIIEDVKEAFIAQCDLKNLKVA